MRPSSSLTVTSNFSWTEDGTRSSLAKRPMFGNSGKAIGRLLLVITPGGFEKYLEEIGAYSPATDMPKIIEISNLYGITFYL
jgi:hypothetical protein